MISTQGLIKVNDGDSTLFESPSINVEAIATYKHAQWNIHIEATIIGFTSNNEVKVVKSYDIPGDMLASLDKGDGKFAGSLGFIVESIVAEDLKNINPESLIEVNV